MLQIKSIPAFNDNYIWLIENSDHRCAVVDPGDAKPVLEYINQHNLTLDTILITHHHHDHTGGVKALLDHYSDVDVIGPADDPVSNLTQQVSAGDQITLFDERFWVLGLPGHTLGHIGYVGDGKLFCGDVLFSGGCGRVFEGTMEQMYTSLEKLASLPEETEVYCAHEYTASNIAFAIAVEPNNEQLQIYRDEVIRLRAQDKPTIPTTLRREKWVNPFLRTQESGVIKSVANRTSQTDPISIFSALREWKNNF